MLYSLSVMPITAGECGRMRSSRRHLMIAALAATCALIPAPRAAAAPSDRPEVSFTVGEGALMAALRAALPQTITVGSSLASADLVLSDPSDLVLRDGAATFKVRVRGRNLPVDQVLIPVIRIDYDRGLDRYYGVVSRLPLEMPGVGTIDLKEYIPRLEI